MKDIFRLLGGICWVSMVMVLLVGCGDGVVEEPVEEVKTDLLVARVASIHKEEGYALVQRYGRLNVGDNAILYTTSVDGETANLKVTGERLGQFLAVDIMSGELSIGDAVYLRELAEEGEKDDKDEFISGES